MEKKQNASKLISSLVALSLATTLGVPSLAIAEEQGATAQQTNAAPASGNEAPTPQEGESAPSAQGVAEVAGVTYPTLQEAITAAQSGAVVKMLGNTTENVTINKSLTLDLNGFRLDGGNNTSADHKYKAAVTTTGNIEVTIKDTSESKAGVISRSDTADTTAQTKGAHYVIDNQCKQLTIESGTIENHSGANVNGVQKGASLIRNGNDQKYGTPEYSAFGSPTLTISGGKLVQDNFVAVKNDCGTLSITGGEIQSNKSQAVQNWWSASIEGGTITGDVFTWNYQDTGRTMVSNTKLSGGTITGNVYAISYDGGNLNATVSAESAASTPLSVNGKFGTFVGSNPDKLTASSDPNKATIAIKSGTFNDLSALDYTTEDAEIGINLASSVTLSSTKFVNAAKVDLNLGEGSTITAENVRALQVKRGELNITGSGTITSTGSLDCSSSVIRVGDKDIAADTKLTIGKDVKVSAPSSYGITAFGAGSESVEINGTVESDAVNDAYDGCAVSTYGTDTTPATIIVNEGATITAKQSNGIYMPSGNLTVNGGSISGTTGIYVKSGTATIKGGTITGTGEKKDYQFYGNGGISTGEALVIDNCGYPNGTPEISVTGGTFESTNADAVGSYGKDSTFDEVDGFISGGTFSSDPTDYLASGYRLVKQADGTYAAQQESVAPKPEPTTETTTTENPDGTITTTVTDKKTGESTSTTEGADGTTIVEKTDASGATTTKITVPEEAAKNGVVEVPAAIEVASGQEVSISAPAGTVVSIPAGTADAGSVVVVVNADGTETPVPLSLVENGKIIVKLSGDQTIKVIDNAKDFVDVPADHWAASDIDFASAREIFKGIDNGNTYEPETALTRNMMMTVLARVDGVDTTGSDPWYAIGNEWAVENGVSNGLWGEDTITREQLVTMLFNYANKAGLDTSARADLAAFPDASDVSDWAKDAVSWAVAEGILKGVDNVAIDPQGFATRAQAAAFMARYVHAALL